MKQAVTELYARARTALSSPALLAEQGYKLVRGDRADFCIVDAAGHLHSLARRIDGITAATLRVFMRDVNPS